MDQVQIHVGAYESNWRERCYPRVESLKATVNFPGSEKPFSDIFGEKYSTIFELQKAVQNGDVDNFVDVLEKVCSEKNLLLSDIFYQVTPAGDSLLHEAAHFRRANIAELIGHHFPQLLTRRNRKLGDTPLHVAARAKSSDVIKVILSQYEAHAHKSTSSIEEINEDSVEALEAEKLKITKLTNEYGNTALHEAVCSKHLDGVTLLFEADKTVTHYLNKSGISPLYLAVLSSNSELVHVLLETPIVSNCHGNSPLHAAIYAKNAALMKEIVEKKPKLMYFRDEEGGTPLHYAAYRGYVEGVRLLLEKSALTALELNTKGHLPIHLACKRGHLKVVKHLLQEEWFDDSRILVNEKGQNILHMAAKNGRYRVVNYLLKNTKLDINQKDKDGNTPLHLAAKNSFVDIVFSLTRDKRIDVNLINNEGFTAYDIIFFDLDLYTPTQLRQRLSAAILYSIGALNREKARSMLRERIKEPKLEWIKDRVNILILVAILIVTVTFAAGFSVPGGVYSSDDPNPHDRGMAILRNRALFKIFDISNTVAMYCSILGSLLLMWTQFGDFFMAARACYFAFLLVGMALMTMSLAFMAAVRLVVNSVSWLADLITIAGVIFVSLFLSLHILATFPLGTRMPVLRRVSNFFLWISLLVFVISPKIKSKRSSKPEKDSKMEEPSINTVV